MHERMHEQCERADQPRGRSRTRAVQACRRALIAVLSLHAVDALPGVYRCNHADAPVLYAQFGCPADTTDTAVVEPRSTIVTATALSAAEQDALAELERSLASATRQRSRALAAERRQRVTERGKARARCRAALRDLDALRVRKRQGYAAREANKLDHEERQLDAARKLYC